MTVSWALAARHENPTQLTATAAMMLARVDPDGNCPDDDRAWTRRGVTLFRRPDGSWALRGDLTDDTGLALRTWLNALAAPRPAEDGQRDPRSLEQRQHDALLEMSERVLASGTLPDAGGAAVTILVRCDPDDLADPDGLVQTEHGDLMRTTTLLRMAGDAELIPVTFDRGASNCELFLGRTRRLANRS